MYFRSGKGTKMIFLAYGLNIESMSHYLANGLTVGWVINRDLRYTELLIN